MNNYHHYELENNHALIINTDRVVTYKKCSPKKNCGITLFISSGVMYISKSKKVLMGTNINSISSVFY